VSEPERLAALLWREMFARPGEEATDRELRDRDEWYGAPIALAEALIAAGVSVPANPEAPEYYAPPRSRQPEDRYLASQPVPAPEPLDDDEREAIFASAFEQGRMAAPLDVERLARALADSGLMRRYADYANGLPTMIHGTPEQLAPGWAAAIARAYAEQDA